MFILLSEPEKNICPAGNGWKQSGKGEKSGFLRTRVHGGFMNGSKAGDVNPYFACIAALGLLAETKNCPMTETEKAVGRYLDWHTGILLKQMKNESTGKRVGNLFIKKKADSGQRISWYVSFSYRKISGKDRKYRPAGILEKRNQLCIKRFKA